MTYLIKHYGLEQGALEIAYIEEFFSDFPRRKTADEILRRLDGREHLILMAEAQLPDDPGQVVPVAYKVSHRIDAHDSDHKLADLVDPPLRLRRPSRSARSSTAGSGARGTTGGAAGSSVP